MANLFSSKGEELRFLRDRIHVLEETITTHAVKTFVVTALELYLSIMLVLSLFECIDPDERDEQELQYMTQVAWVPMPFAIGLVFGHKVAPRFAPAPENLDRNLRITKIITWIYSLAFLIWDKDMTLKQGPALQVAVLFIVCDLARFEMEAARLIDDDEDEEEEELEQLANAASIAETATAEEEAFKNELQAIANQRPSASPAIMEAPTPTPTPSLPLQGVPESTYQQYNDYPPPGSQYESGFNDYGNQYDDYPRQSGHGQRMV
ncbi:hypothetical protein Poli38472_006875 [Pythium oligandrum]|uniref:Uncharacterized protein n=1 Tax=Pythium oligandrum TaxID=41045 RepID=A0A8K1FB38_PYTOL|nr:hypothetical protein Poli38472_006875 [Pythium oligandrum]|eukprot:TMW56865.1 hypothetical protein Poli38472_006875 [Pythium oligandrum]